MAVNATVTVGDIDASATMFFHGESAIAAFWKLMEAFGQSLHALRKRAERRE
jgi:hypothetical protein